MVKIAQRYLEVDPWRVVEKGFHPKQSRVSESIFALANEYMGVRGYFEEGYGGDQLIGSYFSGFYEEAPVNRQAAYKGLIDRARFMVNTVDWLFTRIEVDGEILDLARSKIRDYQRTLDFQSGILDREFVWETDSGKRLKLNFRRFVSMVRPNLGAQQITLTALNFSGPVQVQCGLDFSPVHAEKKRNFWCCPRKGVEDRIIAILGKTENLSHKLFSGFHLRLGGAPKTGLFEREKFIGLEIVCNLKRGEAVTIEKMVTNYAAKNPGLTVEEVWQQGIQLAAGHLALSFDEALAEHTAFWAELWRNLDIAIEGDPENQQGIRFCLFQLHQTFHGANSGGNIGAKGLTGEAYNGHTFWDTETYCLPFYLFNNPAAARNLLEFRYHTLPQARARAKELDCIGAFYPIATIDGTESCGLWQHASLQLQVGSAVAYGIWHYTKVCGDFHFLYEKGIEMLIEISRYYASRGQWSPRSGEFGFYGVMGPDEFHMMVNNNCYLNFMAKKTFEFTLETLARMAEECPDLLAAVTAKSGLQPVERENWARMAARMRLPQDKATGLYEQHDGYFDLPHLDPASIPVTDFPLYDHWAYDRIYRFDLIKQPDVLMFMFLYNQEFSAEVKRVNYDYYEPRCLHESSLSPSIHSIFANELGYYEQAAQFFRFATRLDLDNYNRNTDQGLHLTSIAAAWMNIVYGFGGLRSDGPVLTFNPSIPREWQAYRFRLLYRGAILQVSVGQETAEFKLVQVPATASAIKVKIYGEEYLLDHSGLKLKIPQRFRQ